MKKGIFLTLALLVLASTAYSQQGQAILKIVVDKDGHISVFDMKGNAVGGGIPQAPDGKVVLSDMLDSGDPEVVGYRESLRDGGALRSGGAFIQSLQSVDSAELPGVSEPVPQPQNTNTGKIMMQRENMSRMAGTAILSDGEPNGSTLRGGASVQETKSSTRSASSPLAMPNLTFDLAHTSWEFTPGTHVLKLKTRVINTGDADAGTSKLVYYLSPDPTITKFVDCAIGDDGVGILTPGQFDDETFSRDLCNTSCGEGTWYIGWIIDVNDNVTESNENDNAVASSSTINLDCSPLSNLTLDVGHTNWTFNTNTCELAIDSRVINTGEGRTAKRTWLGYYLSADTQINTTDSRIGRSRVGFLDPGEFSDETFSANLQTVTGAPPFDPNGTYYLGWIVDYRRDLTETNEDDNRFHSNTTITCGGQGPNLTLDVTNSNWNFDPDNCLVTMNSRVVNTGDQTAGTSRLGYYLSEDTAIQPSDSRIGDDVVSSLAAGAFSDETFSADFNTVTGVPPFDPHGTYYLGWIVDDLNEVVESNENDNRFFSNGTVHCPEPQIFPNLTFDPLQTMWEFDPVTRNLRLRARIVNNGDATAGQSKVGYFLSSNPTISTIDCLLGDDGVPALAPGAFDDETFSRILCNTSCDAGTWYIGWICDYLGEVQEFNENDNTAVSSSGGDAQGTPVFITFDCLDPNLTLDLDHTSWSFDASTCILSTNSRVVNVGDKPAGRSHLGYYLSEDTNITTSDSRLGDDRVSELAPGAHDDESFAADLSTVSGTPPFDANGTFFVGWIVDYRGEVVESDESDNNLHSSSTISCSGPNLVIDANSSTASFDPNICTLSISTRVVNVGTAPASSSRLAYYLSPDDNIATSDSRIGDDPVRSLTPDAGSSESISVDLSVVSGTPPFDPNQTQFVGLICDYLDQVAELDESDNRAVFAPAIDASCPAGGSIRPDAPETASCGHEFFVPVVVGDPEPVEDLFGVSFDLHYPTQHIDFVSAEITDPDGAVDNFLGTDLIFLDTPDEASGVVSIGLSRKAGQGGVSGGGPVVWLGFISSTETPDPTTVSWTLSNIVANDADGNAISLTPVSGETVVSCGCIVWPGDANNDGVVTSADILPIGLHFGRTGPSRPGASNVWVGQNVTCWDPEAATFADCNGHGSVGSEDVLPVGLNFGKTHSAPTVASKRELDAARARAGSQPVFHGSSNGAQTPTIKPVISDISGDSIIVDIQVKEVSDLFGLSFDLVYDTDSEAVVPLDAIAAPFLGTDLVFLPTILADAKTVSVGISRKAGQGGVSGEGTVVKVFFKGFETAPEETVVRLALQNIVANDAGGNSITFTVEEGDLVVTEVSQAARTGQVPDGFALLQNYPNPFNPETAIHFQILERTRVVLNVYDILGNKVRTLVAEEKVPGVYRVVWDGKDDSGRLLSSGVYLYKLQAGPFTAVRKMTFIK